jgi:murein DD-endopeptidase MepM/ murein hydrolase activator NlpD
MRPVEKKFKTTLGYGVKTSLAVGGMHKGVDFAAPIGTPVVACVDGVVTDCSWGAAFGHHVVVDNSAFLDGFAGLWIGYMHLSKVKVKAGQKIKKGQIIGYSGNSGHVTGPHLHLEVQKSCTWNALRSVNPQKWIEA